tara:strand:+ start:178 stop:318 length:141 start_codon:yes stop_codon:yes gene_type:complete
MVVFLFNVVISNPLNFKEQANVEEIIGLLCMSIANSSRRVGVDYHE